MARGRQWTSQQKAKIVLQGLKGRSVAETAMNIRFIKLSINDSIGRVRRYLFAV
jgi:hypothetical protein